jgi:hypothetical protein
MLARVDNLTAKVAPYFKLPAGSIPSNMREGEKFVVFLAKRGLDRI